MNPISFSSFLSADGIFSIIYSILSIATYGVLYYEKKRNLASNRTTSLRHLLLFFISYGVVLVVNSFIAVWRDGFYNPITFSDIMITKSLLMTTVLLVIILQEIDFMNRDTNMFFFFLGGFLTLILIFDIILLIIPSSITTHYFRLTMVVINLVSYYIMISNAVKKSRNSKLFNSKSRIVENIINISIIVLINYFYAAYLMSHNKMPFMYCLLGVLIVFHLLATYRIIHGEPKMISRLDKEVLPYPLIPSLSEEMIDYGKGNDVKARLCFLFENEKPYLTPELSISMVAERLYTNKSYLSKVLNVNMHKNFNEFVNHYRIREAMRLFLENNNLTINDMCRMSGFRNVASFNNAFRLYAGRTPGDWCRSIKNQADEKDKKYNL